MYPIARTHPVIVSSTPFHSQSLVRLEPLVALHLLDLFLILLELCAQVCKFWSQRSAVRQHGTRLDSPFLFFSTFWNL